VCSLSEELASYRYHDASKTCSQTEGFDDERRRITLAYARRVGGEPMHREATQFYAMDDWMRELAVLRSARDGRLRVASRIARAAAKEPWRLRERFTWGALRRTLLPSSRPD
jgi:hypothetical protein